MSKRQSHSITAWPRAVSLEFIWFKNYFLNLHDKYSNEVAFAPRIAPYHHKSTNLTPPPTKFYWSMMPPTFFCWKQPFLQSDTSSQNMIMNGKSHLQKLLSFYQTGKKKRESTITKLTREKKNPRSGERKNIWKERGPAPQYQSCLPTLFD